MRTTFYTFSQNILNLENFSTALHEDEQELRAALTEITQRSPQFPAGKPTEYWINVVDRTREAVYKSCSNQDEKREKLENLKSSNCNLGELLRWDDYRQKSALKY